MTIASGFRVGDPQDQGPNLILTLTGPSTRPGWSPSLSPSRVRSALFPGPFWGQIPQPFPDSYMRDGAHATMNVRSWGAHGEARAARGGQGTWNQAIFGVTERALVLKTGDLLLPDFLGGPFPHRYKEGQD